ncbi:MAG TPA: aminoacyl-tRNA hydrolase [Bryobacteraceae bacterium]|nr:aminoacyl-tRNA hydrolase [Bryobacteraceae bacterium]
MDAEPSSLGENSGLRSVFVIAGLGNPGVRYEATPHNAGFWVVDELAARHLIHVTKNEGGTLTGSGKIRNRDVILVKPQTFMNNSGAGIGAVLKYRNLGPENLIVVHDELDLPWSALRIKTNSSAAGHNGVKSIIAALKTNVFNRVRVGIRPEHPVNDAAEYVLAPLERGMREEMGELVSYTADAIETIVAEGAVKAMAKFNRRARGSKEEDE